MSHATIPDTVKESLIRYVDHRLATGDFLRAVLSNDLVEAVRRGDPDNLTALPAIVSYVYNELPADCWGSRDIVEDWLNERCVECGCSLAHSTDGDWWCSKCDVEGGYP